MITDALITAAAANLVADKLSASAQLQLLTYIRQLDRYKNNPGLFPGLPTRLSNASGADAQFLQAALNGAKAIGSGSDNLGANKSADVNWDRTANRNEFFNDALNYLYEVPARRPTSAVVQMGSSGNRSSICVLHLCRRSLCGCSAVLVF